MRSRKAPFRRPSMTTRAIAGVTAAVITLGMAATPSPAATPSWRTPQQSAAVSDRGQASPTIGSARLATRKKHVRFTRWGTRSVRQGSFVGTRHRGGVVIGRGTTPVRYRDPYGSSGRLAYDRGQWFSPWVRPGFGLTELIASYNASTPVGTFIEISARGRSAAGQQSSWDSLGRWASHDRRFHRMSLGAQADDLSRIAVDTLVTSPGVRLDSWQLRVSLFRRTDSGKTPTLTMVGALASQLPATSPTSQPRAGGGVSLAVPKFSQMIHAGEYPQWDGGGEAWCSPTSTSMLLAYWGTGPTPRQYAWVNGDYRQPWVDYAARHTFAWGYDGTGDWPFNTAYAGGFGLDSFVTRLRSLREAELFIRAGIPLVASIGFDEGELDGSPLNSTSGHVLIIRGFTETGRVMVNDPAAATARGVRRVYDRSQFEDAWLDTSGGVVYVIHPRSVALPQAGRHTNW